MRPGGRLLIEDVHQEVAEVAWKSLQTGDVHQEAAEKTKKIHQEAAGRTKVWKSLQTKDIHQEEAEKTEVAEVVEGAWKSL